MSIEEIKEEVNPYGNYGFKEDGTPRQRPKADGRISVGRKKGAKNKDHMVVQAKMKVVIDYATMGAPVIRDPENKKRGVKAHSPLRISEACKEAGLTLSAFNYHLSKDPGLKAQYELYREAKRELLKMHGESNLEKGLAGELDLTDKELMDFSLKVLERTDKAYNPKIEIEQTARNLNFNMSMDELQEQMKDLLGIQ